MQKDGGIYKYYADITLFCTLKLIKKKKKSITLNERSQTQREYAPKENIYETLEMRQKK